MHPTSGGYLINRTPLVRTGHFQHTVALERPVSDRDLKALNIVQKTPWRINRRVLETMVEAWDLGLEIPGLPRDVPPELPERMTDEAWAALDEAGRKARNALRGAVHAQRAAAEGRSQAFHDRLSVAVEMQDHDRFWFPHARDFRGRLYPIPVSGPHPQGDDVAKSLIEFADGRPLGDDGLYWLCVRAANAYGMDKMAMVDRCAWTLENKENIWSCATYPLEFEWWREAENPWGFLATCFELGELWGLEDIGVDPSAFVSRLPIAMDGSCNGLQHLSAMGLDPVGSAACNLGTGPRQDIYEEVAKRVREMVEADAAAGEPSAILWVGRVTRKVCKRAVMTTPYGVTDGGIKLQLLTDGLVPGIGEERGKAAEYLKRCLVASLDSTIQGGKRIMEWLQTVAGTLAAAGLPFDWETPTGSTVRQAYLVTSRNVVDTLVGRLVLYQEVPEGTLSKNKQRSGSAPNVVHSFDAAHLALTVLKAHEEGVKDFALIHDSFATHAGETTRLWRILRETFVAIYEVDWMQRVHEALSAAHPHIELPAPPPRGSFDIQSVLDAEFFFA